MIAVTGANGQLGRLVLSHLARLGAGPVRALVRAPDKAAELASDTVTVVEADYDRPETLDTALAGVDRLVLISGSEIGKRAPQHAAVIAAAKAAGVGFITYTSLLNAPTSSLMLAGEHKATEADLAASGIAHAILRNGWYVENFTGTVAAALQHGAVVGAAGPGRFSAAGRTDYAEAAARIITGDDLATRALELGGQPGFTLQDLADELSRQTGRAIPFSPLSEQDYAALLVQAGLPQGFAAAIADADRGAANGELATTATDLADLIGHPTKPLADFISESLAA